MEEMANVAKKALSTGNDNISLCERGTTFCYNNLVVDFRGLFIMKQSGLPIIFDATHSVQLSGAKGNSSGGDRKFVSNLALAAATQKIAGIFMETHPFTDDAPCDGPNMVASENLEELMIKIIEIDKLVKN
jgi:2-dehydro-3-deoxyphosphooctonate aldolase (KDO 8-P synthase)